MNKKYLVVALIASLLVGGVAGVFAVPVATQWIDNVRARREFNTLVADNIDYEFRDLFESRMPEARVLFVDNEDDAVAVWVIVDGLSSDAQFLHLLRSGFLTLAEMYPEKAAYAIMFCVWQSTETIDGFATIVYSAQVDILDAEAIDTLNRASPIPCACLFEGLYATNQFIQQNVSPVVITKDRLMLREPGFIWPWQEIK
jgi:hypothetical protein